MLYTRALKGSGRVPSLKSDIRQLSNNTDVEWLFPVPYEVAVRAIR